MSGGERLERVLAHLPGAPERARTVVTEAGGPSEIWNEAERFGLRPLLSHYLPSSFPASQEERYSASFRHARIARATIGVAQTLGAVGITSAVLKGAALAARLYPEPWLRPTSDIDLLVAPERLSAAASALEREGWKPLAELPANPFQFRHDLGYVAQGRPKLELHFSPSWHFQSRFDTAALLGRAESLELEGASVKVLAREDDLVHLAVHAAAHGFEGVKWLFDLKLAALNPELDWPLVVERARESHVAHVTGMALLEAHRRVSAPVPESVLESLLPPRALRLVSRRVQWIPERFARTRSYALDLLLADGISRDWLLRLTAPVVNRAARLARVEHLLESLGRRSDTGSQKGANR